MKVVYIPYDPETNFAVRYINYYEEGWGEYHATVKLEDKMNDSDFRSIYFLDKPRWDKKDKLFGCEPEKLRFMPVYIHIPEKG